MPNDKSIRPSLLRVPLLRLLAINLAIGACAAVLLVGGLLWLNPGHLRELIFADRAPGIGLVLLLASFVITFGSAAMGSAIMAQGRKPDDDGGGGNGGATSQLAMQKLPRRAGPNMNGASQGRSN
ncbi:hypothetical protein L6654_32290 [Bradyrhizobium sp. WYCCWR 13023]|uniref:Uncharacterized protein n=1 Tax=Bradyrhizobium zhengyangense TaxID=2911009 RepID=A0A9X1UDE0_9BRAD|nr:hypothetical protein [Bradyrhizobium zhengyangense]MCG2631319.1 hypothetical protein [Bradyrhizobium zhengyangense]MCG2644183.1 hypothetical protein [Bradyrhizobium zhengyangense]MCG2669866.1 hypothetical protein [Bradyrhizobium zhengyangense]